MNKLATLAIVILVICGAALWLITPSAFNDFVKTQLETVGSELTQQTVTVKKVDFRLARGMATISDLTITNPPNYQQKNAFTLGAIALDIDIASLTKEPIVLESFTIDNAKAFVELSKKGRANFQDIIAAINKNITKTQQPTSNNSEQMEPKVRLEKLILSDIGLTLDLRQLGNKVYQQNLPEINLGSIGGQAGLPVSQLGMEISKKVIASIWQQAKKIQGEKFKAKAKAKLKEKVNKLEKKAKQKLNDFLKKFN